MDFTSTLRGGHALAPRVPVAVDRLPVVADLLDSLGSPILLIDPDLAIHCRNKAAERLLEVADGIACAEGRLTLQAPFEARLRELCGAVRDDALGHGRAMTRIMRVARFGASPDLVLLCHVRPAWASDPQAAMVLVVVMDGQLSADVGSLLRDINGLTRTESVVVQGLLRGARLADIARELEMSPETARAHIKRAFKKVGVHSQPQLIRHIAMQMFTLAQFCGAD